MTVTEKATHPSASVAVKKRKHSDSSDELQTLHIVVRRVGKAESESLVVALDSDATVLDLKEKIAQTLEEEDGVVIPTERQRLIFSGKMLRDETLRLETDLNMKAGDDHKHFVHLTPLPKGAAPSARTERELSDNPMSPQEATLHRARARQRRRRRQEPRRELTDPAAYHPYALDLASGSLLPTGTDSTNSASAAAASLGASLGLSVAPAEEAATLLSVAAAAEHSRLVQEVASRAVLPDALQAVVLAQQHQNLLAAAAAGGSAAAVLAGSVVAAPVGNPLCPLFGQADTATSLLESTLLRAAPPTAASMLRLAQPQQQQLVLNPFTAAAVATMPPETNPAEAALQELVRRSQSNTPGNEYLPEILDQIAANAGELASTLRLLSPTPATSTTVGLPMSPAAAAAITSAAVSAASTPHHSNNLAQGAADLARRLILEERLSNLSSSSGSFLPGGLPGFF